MMKKSNFLLKKNSCFFVSIALNEEKNEFQVYLSENSENFNCGINI